MLRSRFLLCCAALTITTTLYACADHEATVIAPAPDGPPPDTARTRGPADPPAPPPSILTPVVHVAGGDSGYPGDTVHLRFSFDVPGGEGAWSYIVRWGDGGRDSGSAMPGSALDLPHTPGAAGRYEAVVAIGRLTDGWTIDSVPIVVHPEPAPAILLAAGDIASCSSSGDEATAALLDSLPGAVAALGDNVYGDASLQNFLSCYEPSWGRHKARTHPATGNHEYEAPGAAGYFAYFGAAAGDPKEGWYSYDLGSWHIVVLNSNYSAIDTTAEKSWLRADLAAHSTRCTLAYAHFPRFGSGLPGGGDSLMRGFWEILQGAGVEVVLGGHDHGYERFRPQRPDGTPDRAGGIRQFVVGTGGASTYGIGPAVAGSEAGHRGFGLLKLSLGRKSYRWDFVPVAGDTWTDSGSTACH
jgi:hypothetical protein